jgi:prolyl-tRNA editing enzyme YbaK/EbsC (Cys-tRNA(Pro) deacylase)
MTELTDYLERKGIAFEVLTHERAFTGIAEARALGVDAHVVVKTVIVETRGEHVAMVLPAEEHLDMKLVREVLDDPAAELAEEDAIVMDFAWSEPGALPPIAPLLGVDVIVDPSVPDTGPVLFAAGRQTVSLKVEAEDLFGHQPVQFSQISDVWSAARA